MTERTDEKQSEFEKELTKWSQEIERLKKGIRAAKQQMNEEKSLKLFAESRLRDVELRLEKLRNGHGNADRCPSETIGRILNGSHRIGFPSRRSRPPTGGCRTVGRRFGAQSRRFERRKHETSRRVDGAEDSADFRQKFECRPQRRSGTSPFESGDLQEENFGTGSRNGDESGDAQRTRVEI